MKEIYIIRHGETDLNKQGIVQGRGIDSSLNEKGIAQGEAFYQSYKDIKFDKIYTSSLKRTAQTVQKFIDSNIAHSALRDLDELAWGIWEGKPNNEAAHAAFKDLVGDWENGIYDSKFENGESVSEVYERLKNPMRILSENPNEQKILLCMHGRAMRIFLCLLTQTPLKEMGTFPHQNTVLYKVGLAAGKFSILEFNNVSHLEHLTYKDYHSL